MERLYRGHFSESILEEGNPNIEKIICPLTKIQGASNQFYTLFAKENLTAQEYLTFIVAFQVNLMEKLNIDLFLVLEK